MARQRQQSQIRNDDSGPAAASRRKEAIDRGLTGDKVPGSDPAAAPLGTDAETAGASPVVAAEPPLSEGARADPAGLSADPSGTNRGGYRMEDRLAWPAAIVLVLIALAIILAILLMI